MIGGSGRTRTLRGVAYETNLHIQCAEPCFIMEILNNPKHTR